MSGILASEAGLTSGSPVLSAAELKAMAPEPLPVVADPATSVNVTPKGIAQAEQLATELPKPAKKKDAKPAPKDKAKTAAKSKSEKTSKDKVASKDKKSEKTSKDKVASKDKAKSEKTSKDKVASKDKKSDKTSKDKVASKDKKSEKTSKDKVASKDKKSEKTSKDKIASKDKKSDKTAKDKIAAKPAKSEKTSKDKTAAKPAKVAKKSSTDEDELVEKPAKSTKKTTNLAFGPVNGKAKSAKKPVAVEVEEEEVATADEDADASEEEALVPAKPSKKSATVAKNAKPAKKALPVEEDESEEVAEAPKAKEAPKADPSVIAPEDARSFTATISGWLRSIATIETGGSADVKLSGMHYSTVQGKQAIVFEGAKVVVNQVKLQSTHVRKATLELRNLAIDAVALKGGITALVGTPTVVPDLTLEHAQVQAQLGKNNIKNPSIAYEGQQMVFTGKAPFMFFSIPFRMAGSFQRNGNNIAFRIADLQIKGSAAGADRRASVQAKLDNMIKLENVLAPLGAPGAPVRGGKVNIEDGANVVFSVPVDGAVPAE